MKKTFSYGIFLIFLFLLLGFQQSYAETYYVSQNEVGNGLGLDYKNRMSVYKHNNASFKPGDVIYLCDTINSKVVPPSSGVKDREITYKGNLEGHIGVIDRKGGDYGLVISNKDYIVIDGIEVKNFSNDGIILSNACDYITVKRCKVHNGYSRGIVTRAGSSDPHNTNIIIGGSPKDGNEVWDMMAGVADIACQRTDGVLISHNKLYGNNGGVDGILTEVSTNLVIEYNEIFGHNSTGPQVGEDGIDIKRNSNNVVIRYNKIYDHKYQTGITIQMGSYDIQIYRNIIHNNFWAGILLKTGRYGYDGDMTDIRIWNNHIYKNGVGVYISSSGDNDTTFKRIDIHDNLITDNGGDGSYYGGGIALRRGYNINVYSNELSNNKGSSQENAPYKQVYIDGSITANFKNNTYFFLGKNDQKMFDFDGSHKTLKEWQELGYDTGSSEKEPTKVITLPSESGINPPNNVFAAPK